MVPRRRHTLEYAARAGRAVLAEPSEGIERVIERVVEWRDLHGRRFRYAPAQDIDRRVHLRLGLPWPCPETDEFADAWSSIGAAIAERGLAVGRGAYGGWDDGDAGLARLAWCLVRHLAPDKVVETGVARGFTTATILAALDRNGAGRLWSIDLPPLIERDLGEQTGAAVVPELRDPWTLLRGSSRRFLPGLIHALGSVQLFVHDSMHTTRNVSFELEKVWSALEPGGAVLVDDVERNRGYGDFVRAHGDAASILGTADDGHALIGCLLRDGASRTSRAGVDGR